MNCQKQNVVVMDLEVQEQNNQTNEQTKKYDGQILKQTDLYELFPFQKTKVQQLIKSGQLPLVKIGKDYITTYKILEEWISDHIGEEIFY